LSCEGCVAILLYLKMIFYNLINRMSVREEKVIVELVGGQYSWDGLPSLGPLAFFV